MADAARTHAPLFNYIDGEWTPARSGRTAPNINPANGESLGEVALSGREEALAAVAAAKAAAHAWRMTPAPKRGEIVARAAELFVQRKEELAVALTREEGKTLVESRGEVQRSINVCNFMAGEGRRLTGITTQSELPNTYCYTRREPLGVVAVITPWNFPVAIPVWKIAPALVCGNTIVFKPASLTPWTAKIITEVFNDAGLPRGVLNLVLGSGAIAGDVLVHHPDVAALSFTGSNEIGTRLYTDGAKSLKKVQCEMGGKNPIIVLDDADLDLATTATVQGAFGSTGQRCTATSRAVVVESVLPRYLELLEAKTRALVLGDGMDPRTQIGPAVDGKQLATDVHYIEVAKSEGATLVCGGERLGGEHAKGFFVAPTIFTDVDRKMRIAQEEVFGPVLAVIAAKGFDDAMDIANDTRFGLASAIYTRDISRVFQYADRSDAGILHVNNPTVGGEAHLPFGGVKATGIGGREMGPTAIDFFTEWKTVYVDYTGTVRTTNIY